MARWSAEGRNHPGCRPAGSVSGIAATHGHHRGWSQGRCLQGYWLMSRDPILTVAGLLGLTGVMLGASGAHALHSTLLAHGTVAVWQTAVSYHLVHSVALLALAAWRGASGDRAARLTSATGWCWIAGIILFSGSLYALAMGAPSAVGYLTPIGGLLFLAGWLLVIVMGWRRPPA